MTRPDTAGATMALGLLLTWRAEHADGEQVGRDGKTVSLGQITRTGKQWELHANSRERLQALDALVRAQAPAARQVSRRLERIGGEPPDDGRTVRTLEMDNYITATAPALDQRRAQEEFMRIMQESWLDTPNSLGMTPRQAAEAGGGARAELDALLDDMQ